MQAPGGNTVTHYVTILTHCGLMSMMPYGDIELGQHWLRQWLVAWWHQAITWTNVDLSSVRSSDNYLRANSQKTPQPSITKISLKITYRYLRFHSNLTRGQWVKWCIYYISQLTSPGDNELIVHYLWQEIAAYDILLCMKLITNKTFFFSFFFAKKVYFFLSTSQAPSHHLNQTFTGASLYDQVHITQTVQYLDS